MGPLFGYGNFPKNFIHGYNTSLKVAYDFAQACHDGTGHKYDDESYFDKHILAAFHYGLKFIHLVPIDKQVGVLKGILCHDVIEDCRITFNNLVEVIGYTGAMITYACTNNKGKDREERADASYYNGINNTPFAEYAKVVDRLANTSSSVATGHGMAKKYKKEFPHFRENVQRDLEFSEMWHHLKHMTYALTEIPALPLQRGDMVEHRHAGEPLVIEKIVVNFDLDNVRTTLICTTITDLLAGNTKLQHIKSEEVQPYL